MKKVLIIGGFWLPQGNASSVRALGNAALIRELGYEPIVVGKIRKKNSSECWYEYDNVLCFDIECRNDEYGKTIQFVDELLKGVGVKEIYAIIAYNFPAKALGLLNKFSRQNKIIMISDATEWYAFELLRKSPLGLYSALCRKIATEYRMRYVNKKIGNIICSTYYLANYYKKNNTVVVPMIAERKSEQTERTNPISSNRVKKFIYAGSPGYKFRKDKVGIVVKSFQALEKKGKDFLLNIYGISEEEYRMYYEFNECDRGHIVFHGRVEREVVLKALQESDFYVLYRPNNKVCRVGFSTKVMEAISNGVPLIANDVNGDYVRYFTHDQALICNPDSEKEFINLLNDAIEMDDSKLLEMKKNCLMYNPFDISQYLDSVRAFFSKAEM